MSFSGFVFSCRMRFSMLKNHKIATTLSVLFVVALFIWGIPAYNESWLDPFATLNVPDRVLHPHAISQLGIMTSDDPFTPYSYSNQAKIQDLMHDLQRANPLPSSDQSLLSLDNLKIQYFTLHRAPSTYHTEEDFALQYYPEKGIIRFGQQYFRINEATIYALSQIYESKIAGWWK